MSSNNKRTSIIAPYIDGLNEAIEILNNLKTDKAKKSALELLRQIQILEG